MSCCEEWVSERRAGKRGQHCCITDASSHGRRTAYSAADDHIQQDTLSSRPDPLPVGAAESAAAKPRQPAACLPRYIPRMARAQASQLCTGSMCRAQNACSVAAHRAVTRHFVQRVLRVKARHLSESLDITGHRRYRIAGLGVIASGQHVDASASTHRQMRLICPARC